MLVYSLAFTVLHSLTHAYSLTKITVKLSPSFINHNLDTQHLTVMLWGCIEKLLLTQPHTDDTNHYLPNNEINNKRKQKITQPWQDNRVKSSEQPVDRVMINPHDSNNSQVSVNGQRVLHVENPWNCSWTLQFNNKMKTSAKTKNLNCQITHKTVLLKR